MAGTVHVVGAGLAGLSAASALAGAGRSVVLHEAAKQAGGRCRSYYDPVLDLTIDNGNHLVLSGNPAVARFRSAVGADPATLAGPDHADFAFADLRTGERWTVRVNDGPLPWWVLDKHRRVPGTRARDYWALGRLMRGRTVQTSTAEASVRSDCCSSRRRLGRRWTITFTPTRPLVSTTT